MHNRPKQNSRRKGEKIKEANNQEKLNCVDPLGADQTEQSRQRLRLRAAG